MVAIVQTSARATYPGGGASGTTSTITLTGVTAGNLIAVINIAAGAPDASTPAISVSDGTIYTQGSQKVQNDGSNNWAMASIHFLPNAAGGTHTIVSTNSAGAFNCYGFTRAVEISGLLSASPLDITNIVNGNASSADASTGTTGTLAQASEIVLTAFSAAAGGNITITEPSGFTNIDSNVNSATFANFGMGSADYQVTASTTALNADWGAMGRSAVWAACACSFKANTNTLSASNGSYALSGQAVSFSLGSFIPNLLASSGTYNYVGAFSSSDFNLLSAFGAYSYTGISAQLVAVASPVSMLAGSGSYSIAAQTATLTLFVIPPNSFPSLIGEYYWLAISNLQASGIFQPAKLGYFGTFPITITWARSAALPGIVLKQSIAPGTLNVKVNAPITLTVSEFPIGVVYP